MRGFPSQIWSSCVIWIGVGESLCKTLTSIQVLLFGTIPTWTDLLGAGLILLTVIAITTEKNIMDMICRGNDKATYKEQSGEENQAYKAEDSGDTITPILPSRNDFSYGSTDLIRKELLIPQEISQTNPTA